MRYKLCAPAVLAAALIACGDGIGPEDVAIEISPRFVADTVESAMPTKVRIRVREGTTPLASRSVTVFGPGMMVSTDSANLWAREFTLDAQGTLTVFLFMLREARESVLYVIAGDTRDSIPVSVRPGQVVGVGFPSADTTLRPGDVYSVQLREIDRLGNRRSEVVQPLSVESSNLSVATVHATTATAAGIGMTTLRANTHMGDATATAFVLPDAVLMANPGPALVDGYGAILTDLASVIPEMTESNCPSWHPGGDHLLLYGLQTVQLNGVTSQLSLSDAGVIAGCGAYSANGEWIFFAGRLSTEPESASSIWRIRSDGSELNRITTASAGERHLYPSPSPDGSRVAYASGAALVVHSIESGETDVLGLRDGGPVPRWSPNGDWIAYTHTEYGYGVRTNAGDIWARPVRLIRPDGSQDHSPTASTPLFVSGAISWSRDGQWLVGNTFYNGRFIFVRASTGEVLRSRPVTAQYRHSLWRP